MICTEPHTRLGTPRLHSRGRNANLGTSTGQERRRSGCPFSPNDVVAGYGHYHMFPAGVTVADTSAAPRQNEPGKSAGQRTHFAGDAAPPWCLLVCADLGYRSQEPAKLLAADWGRFFTEAGVRVNGTVPSGVGQPSFDVALRPATLDDLSPSRLTDTLPHLKKLVRLRDILLSVGDGMSVPEALDAVEAEQTAASLHERARGALEYELRSTKGKSGVSPDSFASILEQIEAVIEGDTRRCAEQPFFNDRRAGWIALRQLTTAAGRSATFAIQVYSASRDAMTEEFDDILDQCARQGHSPDLVLWDYPVAITMQHMKTLSRLAAAADRHDAMLLTSIADNEPLLESMVSEDSTGELLLEEHFVPLRRLRANPAARAIVLAGPPVLLDPGATPPAQAGAAWLVAHDIERLLIDGASPLETAMPSGEDLERNFQFVLANTIRIPSHIAKDAASYGLALLSDRMRAGQVALPTLVNPDMAETHSARFGYNMLLNHLRRLTGQQIAALPTTEARDVEQNVRELIAGALAPYRILLSDRAVQVTIREKTLIVDIHCDRNVAEFPLRFQVSLPPNQGESS